MPKFNLLERDYPENKKSSDESINQLRSLAREYRKAHNDLVRKIWDMDYKLAKVDDQILKDSREALHQQLLQADYLTKLQSLLDKIKKIETAEKGFSSIDSKSPYLL